MNIRANPVMTNAGAYGVIQTDTEDIKRIIATEHEQARVLGKTLLSLQYNYKDYPFALQIERNILWVYSSRI